MPGLIEPHTHPSLVALLSVFTDLSGFTYSSFKEVKRVIKDTVHETKPAHPHPWVVFKGWDPALIIDLPALEAKTLDSLATTKYPVLVISQALHSAWLNTKGLATCNITSETKDPEGGKIVRDEDGNPTGMLKEGPAIQLALDKLPKPGTFELAKRAFNALRQYSQKGFTTVTDMGTIPFDPANLAFLSFITLCPECPVRLGAYYTPTSEIKPAIHHVNKKLWFPGVSIWADGSPYAGSMAVIEPYLRTPMTDALGFDFKQYPCGALSFTSVDAQAAAIRPFQDELIATHCHGESAVKETLDAYEQLIRKNPRNTDHRYRLDHASLITKAQLCRATELGVTVTMFINHVYYYGVTLRDSIVGPDRAERFAPTHLATTSGQTHWTIHDGSPCFPINPFLSMKTCVTRGMWKDTKYQLGHEYKSTIEEALKAYTINAAWQLKREKDLGSLEVGKLADLVLLSDNPKVVQPEYLPSIQVLETYVGGECFNHRK